MPLDHLLSLDHFDLASRCYVAERRLEMAEEVIEAARLWDEAERHYIADNGVEEIWIKRTPRQLAFRDVLAAYVPSAPKRGRA